MMDVCFPILTLNHTVAVFSCVVFIFAGLLRACCLKLAKRRPMPIRSGLNSDTGKTTKANIPTRLLSRLAVVLPFVMLALVVLYCLCSSTINRQSSTPGRLRCQSLPFNGPTFLEAHLLVCKLYQIAASLLLVVLAWGYRSWCKSPDPIEHDLPA